MKTTATYYHKVTVESRLIPVVSRHAWGYDCNLATAPSHPVELHGVSRLRRRFTLAESRPAPTDLEPLLKTAAAITIRCYFSKTLFGVIT